MAAQLLGHALKIEFALHVGRPGITAQHQRQAVPGEQTAACRRPTQEQLCRLADPSPVLVYCFGRRRAASGLACRTALPDTSEETCFHLSNLLDRGHRRGKRTGSALMISGEWGE